MWTAVSRFFGGMSLMGYVITFLVAVVFGLSVALAWANHSANKLRSELGASEQAILQLVETSTHHRQEIARLIEEVRQCAELRKAAELSALEADKRLHKESVGAEKRNEQLADAIKEDIDNSAGCNCVVPSRATRLLIDAACNANRDANCP